MLGGRRGGRCMCAYILLTGPQPAQKCTCPTRPLPCPPWHQGPPPSPPPSPPPRLPWPPPSHTPTPAFTPHPCIRTHTPRVHTHTRTHTYNARTQTHHASRPSRLLPHPPPTPPIQTRAAQARVRASAGHAFVCLEDSFPFYCHVLARRYSGSGASTSVALQPAQLRVTAAAAGAAADALGRAQVGRVWGLVRWPRLLVHVFMHNCRLRRSSGSWQRLRGRWLRRWGEQRWGRVWYGMGWGGGRLLPSPPHAGPAPLGSPLRFTFLLNSII